MSIYTHHKNHIVTRILSLIVFIILAVLLFLFGRSVKDNVVVAPIAPVQENQKLIDTNLANEIQLKSESKYGKVAGFYPEFKNVDGSFNDKIRNNITIAQFEFENIIEENWQARINTLPAGSKITEFPEDGDMYLNVKTEYVQVNPRYISVLIRIQGFSGGAHGYESLYSYNYDVLNKKELSLKDFYPNDTNYLKTVSDYSRKSLSDKLGQNIRIDDYPTEKEHNDAISNITSLIEEGTRPFVDNFSIFTYEPGMLTIYFKEYQVAPYVYGVQMIKIAVQ